MPSPPHRWVSRRQCLLDLETGEEHSRTVLTGPLDSAFTHVSLIGRVIYGLRPETGDPNVAYGLYRLNPVNGRETLAASFGDADGGWQPVAMVANGRDRLVISAADTSGRPLPAIVVQTSSGKASTFAEAAFVGTQHLVS